jgi:hypothetical protein
MLYLESEYQYINTIVYHSYFINPYDLEDLNESSDNILIETTFENPNINTNDESDKESNNTNDDSDKESINTNDDSDKESINTQPEYNRRFNNKNEEWPIELLKLNTRELNKYILENGLTNKQIISLKKERRRRLNRFYARKSRESKSLNL